MVAKIELSAVLREALLNPDRLPETFGVGSRKYTIEKPITAGFKGAVWKVRDEYGRVRAAKLAIYADYEDRSFLQELYQAAKLERFREFARFDDAGVLEFEVANRLERFVCFIEEWVEGHTLQDFLTEHPDSITASFFVGYVRGMCNALTALRIAELRHDDLHTGNVMLTAEEGQPDVSYSVKVIDMGSLKTLRVPTKKPKDDWRQFLDHLVAIYNAMHARKLLPIRERRFLAHCRKLFDSMLEDDPTIALRDLGQVRSHFELAYTRAATPEYEASSSLHSPFEYISAEHIANDQLLVAIFAESCPWLDKVASPDPCLITGPRGCGKSTILRWLSLKAHLNKTPSEISQLRISGFYVSCTSDLQNRLSWITTEALANKFKRGIVHYFNLLLAREVVQTLTLVARRNDALELFGLGDAQQVMVREFIRAELPAVYPVMQGVSPLEKALELLEREMARCHKEMLAGADPNTATPETFLADLTTMLAKEVSFFREHRIAFLVDDFSSHRLPIPVQTILNRIIWERRASHIFKLSSEKYGATLNDPFDATVDLTREMVEIDCGREFLALDDAGQREKARKFASDLLANRLRAANYSSTPETLLGESHWAEGSLGRALREKAKGRQGDQYHGMECIADLCSGDVSTLLLVYRRIFERGDVQKQANKPIPKRVQHDAIESVSRELFEHIKHHHPHGRQMHEIVRQFGVLVRRILEDGKLLKKGEGEAVPQCPRIEVDQDAPTATDTLTVEQQELAKELVRRAVFIEMEPGRSRHNFATTLRWQLRRVYLPAFGAALSKNDAVKWKPAEMKFFLTDPDGMCNMEWTRRPKQNPNSRAMGQADWLDDGLKND